MKNEKLIELINSLNEFGYKISKFHITNCYKDIELNIYHHKGETMSKKDFFKIFDIINKYGVITEYKTSIPSSCYEETKFVFYT